MLQGILFDVDMDGCFLAINVDKVSFIFISTNLCSFIYWFTACLRLPCFLSPFPNQPKQKAKTTVPNNSPTFFLFRFGQKYIPPKTNGRKPKIHLFDVVWFGSVDFLLLISWWTSSRWFQPLVSCYGVSGPRNDQRPSMMEISGVSPFGRCLTYHPFTCDTCSSTTRTSKAPEWGLSHRRGWRMWRTPESGWKAQDVEDLCDF